MRELKKHGVNIIVGTGGIAHGNAIARSINGIPFRGNVAVLTASQGTSSFKNRLAVNGLHADVVDASEWFDGWVGRIEEYSKKYTVLVIDAADSASELYHPDSFFGLMVSIADRDNTTIVFTHYASPGHRRYQYQPPIEVFNAEDLQ